VCVCVCTTTALDGGFGSFVRCWCSVVGWCNNAIWLLTPAHPFAFVDHATETARNDFGWSEDFKFAHVRGFSKRVIGRRRRFCHLFSRSWIGRTHMALCVIMSTPTCRTDEREGARAGVGADVRTSCLTTQCDDVFGELTFAKRILMIGQIYLTNRFLHLSSPTRSMRMSFFSFSLWCGGMHACMANKNCGVCVGGYTVR
jgi:hypothetical protein